MFSHKRVERIKKRRVVRTSVTKIQVMGAIELPNGDVRHELFTLGVDNGRDYEPFINKKISVACGYFANGKNCCVLSCKRCVTCSYPRNG